jgi:hypothetical protein
MEIMNSLATLGITMQVLQCGIVAIIAILFIGMFWHAILIGTGIVACAIILFFPSAQTKEIVKVTQTQNEILVEQDDETVPKEYIEDCMIYVENATKKSCIDLWKENIHDDE